MTLAVALSNMRAAQTASMGTDCTVRVKPLVDDGYGGKTEGEPVDTATVCRLAPTSGQEIELGQALTGMTTYTITLPWGTSIDVDDEVIIAGDTYQVKAVLAGGTLATAVRVVAVKTG